MDKDVQVAQDHFAELRKVYRPIMIVSVMIPYFMKRLSWIVRMRITKAYEAINKLGSVSQISITQPYFDLKIAELRLEYELQEKLHAEREEQRMIRDQMREEERAQREIELVQKKAEDEEAKYQRALAKATEEAKRANVRELGDASVPFNVDVHALMYSDNAPELEYRIHKRLADSRINLINNRREFFKVGLTEIEAIFTEIGRPLTLTKLAEAKVYRETLAIREAQKSTTHSKATPLSLALPLTLN